MVMEGGEILLQDLDPVEQRARIEGKIAQHLSTHGAGLAAGWCGGVVVCYDGHGVTPFRAVVLVTRRWMVDGARPTLAHGGAGVGRRGLWGRREAGALPVGARVARGPSAWYRGRGAPSSPGPPHDQPTAPLAGEAETREPEPGGTGFTASGIIGGTPGACSSARLGVAHPANYPTPLSPSNQCV